MCYVCTRQDFCYLTGTPLEQYAIYKKQWQLINQQRFVRNKSKQSSLANTERQSIGYRTNTV